MDVRGGWVHRAPGEEERGDLGVSEGLVVAGSGAPGPSIDATGASVVPLLVESAVAELPPDRTDAWHLVPGRPATFAVVRGRVSADQVRRMLVVQPRDLIAAVVDGRVVARDGRPVRPADPGTEDAPEHAARRVDWVDHRRDMVQHLRADGHYSETRQGRRDAWTGSYWLDGDRITYLDDSGFWAFGQWLGERLHHAGFVLERR
ncbi:MULTISPECIES: Atu4866 domain-containing protein [unclassified Nocardioides]|uniref:Atu4866 domain-containing protein n=1 Tax=unclassified Nocardioides TaxID=2615069 RepID=UPI0030149B1A